jgi:hypothetical protein
MNRRRQVQGIQPLIKVENSKAGSLGDLHFKPSVECRLSAQSGQSNRARKCPLLE